MFLGKESGVRGLRSVHLEKPVLWVFQNVAQPWPAHADGRTPDAVARPDAPFAVLAYRIVTDAGFSFDQVADSRSPGP